MKMTALLLAVILLAACAATPSNKEVSSLKVDAEKVALVEMAAKRAGVQVIWVNPPRAKDAR